ncbi:MAG TPA: thioesterase family protein [Acetobacteraceae bacterium]|nr:thioesterase family protein [Acetobacteraceae bacterium]
MTDAHFPAPFARYEGVVRNEWIDSNGHMNLAYYIVLFDAAADLLFDALGYGTEDRKATGHGPFAVETHTLYQNELFAGEQVRVASQIIATAPKRLHVAYEMSRSAAGVPAAFQEVMYINVDLGQRRSAPFAPEVQARITAAFATHAGLPRPPWIGRHVGITARAR